MNLNRTFDYQSIAQFAVTAFSAIMVGLLLAWLAPLLGGTKYILVGVIGLSIGLMIVGMVTRFRYLHAWSLILLIWTMPMDASIPIGKSIQYAGSARLEIYLVDVAILGSLILLWLSARNEQKAQEYYRDSSLGWAILLFFGLLVLSLLRARFLLNGIYQLIVFVRAFLMFYLIHIFVNNEQKTISLLGFMISLLLFHSAWAIAQWWNQGAIGGEYLRYFGENNPTEVWVEWFAYHGASIRLFDRPFGIYVSGLLGSAYRLSVFLELLLPVVLVHLLYGEDKYINRVVAFFLSCLRWCGAFIDRQQVRLVLGYAWYDDSHYYRRLEIFLTENLETPLFTYAVCRDIIPDFQ